MKTLTEFASLTLKNATAKKQELTTAGKTAEELPAAMGEALKLEGDRLNFLLAALEAVGEKAQDLKRVVVFTLAEGEKAPSGAIQKGEQYYLVERFPPLHKKGEGEHGRGGRDGQGRGDKRGKGKGKGRGGRGGERGERGGRGPRRDGQSAAKPAGGPKPGGTEHKPQE